MNRITPLPIGILAIIGWLTAFSLAAPATKPASAPANPPATPKTFTVATGDLVISIDADATFEPQNPGEVRIKPKVYAGELTVLRSSIKPGSLVKQGDILLEFDSVAIRRDLEAAEIELATATAGLEKAREDQRLGAKASSLALETARLDLEAAQTAMKWLVDIENPATVKQSELSLKAYKDRIEDQKDELDQLKKMYKTEDLTTATADIVIKRSVRQLEQSIEQLKLFEPTVTKVKEVAVPQTLARTKLALEKAELAMEQAKITAAQGAVTRDLAIRSATVALDKARRKIEELKTDLDALTVRAPVNGMLLLGQLVSGQWQNSNPRFLREGEKVAAGMVMMTIVDPARQRAVISVPEPKLALLQPGHAAVVKPRLLSNVEYAGRVGTISPARVGAGFEVQIDLPAVDPRIVPGMTASVKILAEKLQGKLLVPNVCLSGDKVIVRDADGKESERTIATGKSDGSMTEIIRGLNAGDIVVQR